jgi:hypothetical protein
MNDFKSIFASRHARACMQRRVPRARKRTARRACHRPTPWSTARRARAGRSIRVTDPSTLPAPGDRHPTPTRGTVETCAHAERDSSESEAISEEETVAEAEARSKAGAPHEAATKTGTTKSIADKPASEPTKATATEAAAAKTAAVETTATKPTSITGVGSDDGTGECHGG